MTWVTVAQVLVLLLAATAAQRVMTREPGTREAEREAMSPTQRSLVRELESLTEAKRALLLTHTEAAMMRGSASAATAWDAAERVEKRMAVVRAALKGYELSRIKADKVY